MPLKMRFEWNHPKGYINIPLNLNTSTDDRFLSETHIVCEECEGRVEQRYLCPTCDKVFKRGDLKKKHDDLNEITFNANEQREFCKVNIEQTIKVVDEFDLEEMTKNWEFIEKHSELYNNLPEYSPVVKKIFEYLTRNKKGLVVTYGAHGRMRGGIVVPTNNKLLIIELRSYDRIREPVQLELEPQANPIYEKIAQYSEDLSAAVYDQYIAKLKGKEPIEIKKVEQKIKPKIECAFLEA